MRRIAILAIVFTGASFASERMSVSVCNLAGLPKPWLTRAEAGAAAVFGAVDVQIDWRDCAERPPGARPGTNWFTIRLRDYEPHVMSSSRAHEVMGRAFLSESGVGCLADCYFREIQDLARLRQADATALLGQVIAHELGHFLLGSGHSWNSIMRAEWMIGKSAGMREEWLRFNGAQGRQIRQKLRMQDARLLLVASR